MALVNASLNTIVVSLYYHAATQLKILKDTLKYLSNRADQTIAQCTNLSLNDKKLMRNRIIYKEICKCVEHYDAIAKFVQNLDKCFSFIMILEFAINCFVIGITSVQISFVSA